MNIGKAIEIKELELKAPGSVSYNDYEIADLLSIEALKRIEIERPHLFTLRHPLLPGETTD